MRRISVASNAIQTIDNEMANPHYLLFKGKWQYIFLSAYL